MNRPVRYSLVAALPQVVFASAIVLATISAAHGQTGLGIRPSTTGHPLTFPGFTTTADTVVIYNLPSTGPYAGTVNGHFDVYGRVIGGGSAQVAGFGAVISVSGTDEIRFTPAPVPPDGQTSNMPAALNAAFPKATAFDPILGNTNVPGLGLGDRSLGVFGVFPTPYQNTTLTNNQGLFAAPFQVKAGATGSFNLSFDPDPDFTGFVNSDAQLLTQSANNINGVIQVRPSIKGDTNGDGTINVFDIQGFVDILTNPAGFQTARPWMRVNFVSDMNNDLAINVFDIQPFINLLSAPSPAASPMAVPEPGGLSLALVAVALGGFVGRRRSFARRNSA
jgi:hypothetical protein